MSFIPVTSITFEFEPSPKLVFTATPNGIEVSWFSMHSNTALLNPDVDSVKRTFMMFRDLYQCNHIKATISSFNDNVFYGVFPYEDIRKKYVEHCKDSSLLGDSDDLAVDCGTLIEWFFGEVFHRTFLTMIKTCTLLKKRKDIEGKDCPVLQSPLTDSCVLLKKCSHYISREAWDKLAIKGITKKCPLCRAEHTQDEIE